MATDKADKELGKKYYQEFLRMKKRREAVEQRFGDSVFIDLEQNTRSAKARPQDIEVIEGDADPAEIAADINYQAELAKAPPPPPKPIYVNRLAR